MYFNDILKFETQAIKISKQTIAQVKKIQKIAEKEKRKTGSVSYQVAEMLDRAIRINNNAEQMLITARAMAGNAEQAGAKL